MIWLAALTLAAQDAQSIECSLIIEPDGASHHLSVQCDGESESATELASYLSAKAAQIGPISSPVHSADRTFQVHYDDVSQTWVAPNIWAQFGPPSPPASAMRRMNSGRCGVAGIISADGSLADLEVVCHAERNRIASDFEDALRRSARNWRLLPVNEGECFAFPMDYRMSDETLDSVNLEQLCQELDATP